MIKKYITLGEVCEKGSSTIMQKDLSLGNGPYQIYGASGLLGTVDFYKQEKEYIGIVKDGAGVGRAMLLPEKSSCIGTMQYLIPRENINVRFLFYAIESMNLAKYNTGATIPHIYFKDYKKEVLPLFDIQEQQEIAHQFDKIKSLISYRQSQLKYFDDLVKSQFIETFLNRGFQRVALEKVSHGKGEYGAASASVEYIPSRPRYVRITDINDDGTLNDDRVCSVNLSDDSDYKLEYGDFLFARMGATVGKTYVYKTGNQIFAGYLIRYKLNTDKINPYYLYSYTKTPEYESWVQLNQSGAAQPGINAKKYGSLQIPLPPMALQNQFAAFVEQTDKSKVLMEQARKLVQILIKLILNIGTIEKSIQICYNGHRKEVV